MNDKTPSLVIYWADDRTLLSYKERMDLEFSGYITSVTPEEVLLEDHKSGRKLVIRGITDPAAPSIPKG